MWEKMGILPLWGVGFPRMPLSLWASPECPYERCVSRYFAISCFFQLCKFLTPSFFTRRDRFTPVRDWGKRADAIEQNRAEREVRAVVLLAAGQRERETVGDREGLERWSCSPLSRAPGRAAGRCTWALGRVPTWTERCSGAGSTRLLLLGLPRRTSRKKRRTTSAACLLHVSDRCC